jgi:predicted nucleic acid-binding protein
VRILIDQTFWVALIDPSNDLYEKSQEIFKEILAENNQLYVTSFIFNEILKYIRTNLKNQEDELIKIFYDALDSNYLKMINLGRITQRETLKLWKKNPSWPYHPFDLANVFVIKRRFFSGFLTWRKEYKEFNINILNQ